MTPGRVALLGGSLEGGGAQQFALRLADALIRDGHKVWVVSLDANCDFDLGKYPALKDRVVWLSGADVSRGTVGKVVDAPLQCLRLYRFLRSHRIDVVLSLQERSNILNLLLPGAVRRILSVRSYPDAMLKRKSPLKRWLIMAIYGLLLGRADRVILNSRAAAENFTALFRMSPARVDVIYNLCDVDVLQRRALEPVPESLRRAYPGPLVLTGGRMIPDKGHCHLLRAFRMVLAKQPDAALVIAGKGPLEHRLRELARQLSIERHVFFPGFVENMSALISAATVFVLPSRREGFPNALLEAVALGCPSIASDCLSGPRELVAPASPFRQLTAGVEKAACGWLVPPPDGADCPSANATLSGAERALAEAMIELLRDAPSREVLHRAALDRGRAFSPERIIPQWLEVLAAPARG